VQGEQAPDSIVNAIRRIEKDGRSEVLILARGGGATEDMACFNDERVVRAIAECSIPVIAGIGHQRDESLADLAADIYVHTPTAAAEQAVPKLQDLFAEHQERRVALNIAVHESLQPLHEQLQSLRNRLQRLQPQYQIQQQRQALAWLKQRLCQGTRQQYQQAHQQYQLLQQKLLTLDPEAVLRRGYAVVRQTNGMIIRSADALEPGQTLNLQLSQDQIQVQVTRILSRNASPHTSETIHEGSC
jgi:exodeoxyribonuclease VII large subunit